MYKKSSLTLIKCGLIRAALLVGILLGSLAFTVEPALSSSRDTKDFELNRPIDITVLTADGERAAACISFTLPVEQQSGFRPLDYLEVKPKADIHSYLKNGMLCLQGLEWGRNYEVAVRAGVPLKSGIKTSSKHQLDVLVPDAPKSVSFSGSGYILAQRSDAVLPLVTRNVDNVTLTVMRIADLNLVDRLRSGFPFNGKLDQYGIERITKNDGEEVWRGNIEISASRNILTRTGVPLKDVIDTSQPGVHVVTAQDADDELDRWEDRATQWILVSDLGITTFKSDNGLTVFLNSHMTTEPVSGARLKLVARNNRVLGETTTDMNGRADFAAGLLNGLGGAEATAIMVYNGDRDFSVMTISGPAIDLSDRGVAGHAPAAPIDAFVYGDRDIYRPGETVHLAALVRDDASRAIDGLPISVLFIRPDGQTFATVNATAAGAGMITTAFDLPRNAPTGRWQIELRLDPNKPAIGSASIYVEDFVPERLKLELETDHKAASPGDIVNVTGSGHFLFGAPAAKLEMRAEYIIERDPNPFDGFAEYHFGLVTDEWSPKRTELNSVTTDTHGRAVIRLPFPSLSDHDISNTSLPLRSRLIATLLEPGGRGLARSTLIALRTRDLSIGIRPVFAKVSSGQTVSFDIIGLKRDGSIFSGYPLVWELVREERRYHWEHVGGDWRYRTSIHPRVVDNGRLTTSKKPVSVTASVDSGWYRLEVYDPQSGAASSHRFRVGWQTIAEDVDAPDSVQISLNAESYRPGSVARVRINPPYAGTALISVLGNGVQETRRLPVPKDGTELEFQVRDDWGVAGAYMSVTLLRAGNNDRAPSRALGITWLKIDRSHRNLVVDIGSPKKIRPNQRLNVPLKISGLDRGEKAWLTLSAVDQGILSLTNFVTPDPARYYYGQRRLTVELRDSYGRLIDPAYDHLGRLRSGGDAMRRQNRGLEVDAYKSTALFSGALQVPADGRLNVPLDLPDFNGTLRLMAVVATADKVGKGETSIIVRAPLVVELSRPRFLAPGDRAKLKLELYNLEAGSGNTAISLSTTGSVSVRPETMNITLAQGERAVRQVTVMANREGVGQVTLRAAGPGNFSVERILEIPVRPAQAVSSERRVLKLNPNKSLNVDYNLLEGFLPGTRNMSIVVGAGPTFDLPRLIASLSHYPYGCLEQTISKTMPLLYVSALSNYFGLDADAAKLSATAQRGIRHLLTMQRSDGSFGLWSAESAAEPWLTVYALDFMTRARAEGFKVKDSAYQKARHWVETQLVKRGRELFSNRVADAARPYALYALARAGKPDLSALRYWIRKKELIGTKLELATYVAAVKVMGQIEPPTDFRGWPLDQSRDWHPSDYGSSLRDAAMQLALLSEAGVGNAFMLRLADHIEKMMAERSQFSTQERAWLVMAGKAMIDQYRSIKVDINGERQSSDKPLSISISEANIKNSVSIANRGTDAILATLLTAGVPTVPLPAKRQGFQISRQLRQLDGTHVQPSTPLQQGDRYVVIMQGYTESSRDQQALVVDLLPAGLEIENTRLIHGGSLDDFSWLEEVSKPAHMEIRDDRFVAAFDVSNQNPLTSKGKDFRFAYIVRAVTPGIFVWPAAYVEDMYRPDHFARGSMGWLKVRARR